MEPQNSSLNDGSAPSDKPLPQKILALLEKTLSVGLPMTELYALVCRYAVINKKASSAPRPLVEALIRRSSRDRLKVIRSGLLKFFVADGDYAAAAKYLPKKGQEDVAEYYPVMICSLHSGRKRDAQRLYVACMEYYPERDFGKRLENDSFMVFELASAVALYHAYTGDRSQAIDYWGMASESNPLFAQMRSHIVSARLVDALLTARYNLDLLRAKQEAPPPVDSTRPAREQSWQLENAIERIRMVESELTKLLPFAELRKFNIESSGDDQSDLEEEGC